MATDVTNYQCPSCTGPLHYSGKSGKLECEYCGSAYDVAEIEAIYAKKDTQSEAQEPAQEQKSDDPQWNAEHMHVYNCTSCGAELICDENTAATNCPYCGNPTVIAKQFEGVLQPDYVIPFALDQKAASDALQQHCRGKWFLSRAFTSENHLKKFQGVYVPFWLFDVHVSVAATLHATRSQTFEDDDYEVTTTEHYKLERAGCIDFEKIPVDASKKMPDDYMDSLEPYDYAQLKPFSTAYLPGFLADKFDVSIKDSKPRVDERVRNSTLSYLSQTVTGYEACEIERSNFTVDQTHFRYALLPVWLMNTQCNGKTYLFAVNGQTGKVVGDIPVSWKRFYATFGVIAAVLFVILMLIMFLGGSQ